MKMSWKQLLLDPMVLHIIYLKKKKNCRMEFIALYLDS